jgi:hypothetical protein
VFAGTYNVNGKVASDIHALVNWLETEISTGVSEPDLFTIGLQEVVDLNAGNVVMDNFLSGDKGVGKEQVKEWGAKLSAALDTITCTSTHRYSLLQTSHMVGVCLFIFVKDSLLPKIKEIEASVVPTGNMGLANKGAALVRMKICDTTFCFVSAHFAAHRSKVKKRNRDFHVIAKRPVFIDTAVKGYADFSKKAEKSNASSPVPPSGRTLLRSQSSMLSTNSSGDPAKDDHGRRLSAVNMQVQIAVGARRMSKRGSAGDWWENSDNKLFGNPTLPGKTVAKEVIPPPPLPDSAFGVMPTKDKEAAMLKSKEKLKRMLDYEEDDDEDDDEELDKEVVFENEDGKMCCLDHDIVIWVGDLNYRLDVSIDISEVYDLLNVVASDRASVGHEENVDEAIDILHNKDQLVIERHSGRVFKGFEEQRLIFLPTYKYIPGDTTTDWYDNRPDKKMRVPAWCDRVLWRIKDEGEVLESVEALQYRRTDKIYISDHKPVNALLKVTIKEIDEAKKAEVLEDCVKKSNQMVEEMHVTCKVHGSWEFETDGIDEDDISTVVLENCSKRTPAEWSLVREGLPKWMVILGDDEGTLAPGKRIELRARIEPNLDIALDDENEHDIDEVHPGAIIRIKVAKGNDCYIAVMNKWLDRRQKERKEAAERASQGNRGSTSTGSGSIFRGKEGGMRDSLKKKLGMKKRGSAS